MCAFPFQLPMCEFFSEGPGFLCKIAKIEIFFAFSMGAFSFQILICEFFFGKARFLVQNCKKCVSFPMRDVPFQIPMFNNTSDLLGPSCLDFPDTMNYDDALLTRSDSDSGLSSDNNSTFGGR